MEKAWKQEVPTAGKNGGDRRSEEYQSRGTTLNHRDTSDGILARLKRDRPDDDLRERVQRAWREEIAPAAKHGGDRTGGEQGRATTLTPEHRDTADGILARLKRDRPDLAHDFYGDSRKTPHQPFYGIA